MKSFIPVVFAPVVLTGCALNVKMPPTVPAQEFVTTLIQEQIPLIKQAQNELAQVSKVRISPLANKVPSGLVKPDLDNASVKKSELTPLAGQSVPTFKQIRYIGERPAAIGLARPGNARNLSQALKLIIPPGWQDIYSSNVQAEAHRALNWTGNDQWPFVLDTLLQQQGLVALIDWQKQQVSIAQKSESFTPGDITPKPSLSLAQPAQSLKTPLVPATTSPLVKTANTARNPFGAHTAAAVPATNSPTMKATIIAPKAVIKPKVWRIETGSTLKDTLFTWAADEKCSIPGVSHWTVAWLTQVNYRIDAPLQFEGNFREVLNSLFTLYGTTQVPLYAGVRSAQCVISVDDKEIH